MMLPRDLRPGAALRLLLLPLALCLTSASPAGAQSLRSLTKDDCTVQNSLCASPGGSGCDDVEDDPTLPAPGRVADVGDRVQWLLDVANDDTPDWAISLEDYLPSCAAIDCMSPCVDTDCDGTPDSVVDIRFTDGGSHGSITCDPGGNYLVIQDISLEAYEEMEVRFCADFTSSGNCCNEASMHDASGAPFWHSSDARDPGGPGPCVTVGQDVSFWKDDCGPRTTDHVTGSPDSADCDEMVMADNNGDTVAERVIEQPAGGKRFKWVLHFENLDTGVTEFNLQDAVDGAEEVICEPSLDPQGQGWGCFEIWLDGVLQRQDPTTDICTGGVRGGVDVTRDVPEGSTLEVRFCGRIVVDPLDPVSCNAVAEVSTTVPPTTTWRAEDLLDGDYQVCADLGGGTPTCPGLAFASDVTVVPDGDCRMDVSWSPASGGQGAVVYDIYRDISVPVSLDPAHRIASGLAGTSFQDTVAWDDEYAYRVVARDQCTNPGPQEVPNAGGDSPLTGALPIDFPSSIRVDARGDCEMLVEWDPASSGSAQLVYDLYRDTASPVPLDAAHRVAADLADTTFLDIAPWADTQVYRVVARDQCTNPAPQEEPNAGGDSPPEAPVDETPPSFGGVTDTEDAGHCTVLVHWDDATAVDDCSGISLFNIYRDNGVGHAGQTPVGSDTDGSPYEDTTPGNGVWVYVVRAVNGAGLEEQNQVFVQESENSCTNDFPRDAGMKKGKNVDPPNADKQDLRILGMGIEGEFLDIQINWLRSSDDGGLYPVTYSVLRGGLDDLGGGTLRYGLADGGACGIAEDHYVMTGQVDGVSYYYVVVPVSGDNATFGYDSTGTERPEAAVCE